jgi:hypothetical protein
MPDVSIWRGTRDDRCVDERFTAAVQALRDDRCVDERFTAAVQALRAGKGEDGEIEDAVIKPKKKRPKKSTQVYTYPAVTRSVEKKRKKSAGLFDDSDDDASNNFLP